MPLCESNETVARWLESDAEIPMDKRPIFLFQYLTAREQSKLSRALQDLTQMPNATEADRSAIGKAIEAAVLIGLKDWKLMFYRGNPVIWGTPLEDFLNEAEIWQLVRFASRVNADAQEAIAAKAAPSQKEGATAAA